MVSPLLSGMMLAMAHASLPSTAAVVEAGGGHAYLYDHALPTPLTAFAKTT